MLLSACIIVDDFGPAWEEAQEDLCISRLAEAFYENSYKKRHDSYDGLIRTITINDANFILLKENASDAGGHLYPFFVETGILISKRADPVAREYYEDTYARDDVIVEEDTITLTSFDVGMQNHLAELNDDARLWEEDLKMLYNTRLDRTCRFEDRNIDELM